MLATLILLMATAFGTPIVAIADLANDTGDTRFDGAGAGVAGILISRFLQTDGVRVVEREALVSLLAEQQLSLSGLTDPSTAARAGRLLGAEYLVVGELFSVQLPSLSIALRVIDTETGEAVVSRDVVGQVGDDGEQFFQLIDQLSEEILGALEVELSAEDQDRLSAIERREMAAVLRYGEDLIRVNTEHPMALYRETDRDFNRDKFTRIRWMVYDRDNVEVPMPAFARRVGDEEMNVAWGESLRTNHRKAVRTNLLTLAYGVLGIGLAAGGGRVGDGDANPETPTALQGVGVSMIVISPLHLVGNAIGQAGARQKVRYPGAYYTPEEADRWINAYNRSLQ